MVRQWIVQQGEGYTLPYPANSWEDGILLGNGTMGASALGGAAEETLTLSHERLFAPVDEQVTPIPMAERLPEIRSLLDAGKAREATELIVDMYQKKEGLSEKLWTNPFFPAADVHIRTENAGIYEKYQRSLTFATGEGRVRYTAGQTAFQRNYVLSRADQCLGILLSSDGPASYQISLARTPYQKNGMHVNKKMFPESGGESFFLPEIRMRERGLWYLCGYNGKKKGYGIVLCLTGINGAGERGARSEEDREESRNRKPEMDDREGGCRVTAEGTQSLRLRGCREALLLVSVFPVENMEKEELWEEEEKRLLSLGKPGETPREQYRRLLENHVQIHGERYGRIRLELENPHLEAMFGAGRYEILSSCGKMPPNLQGVWTGTYDTPWSSDYTQNGNLQTAILALLPTGDFEGMESYFDYQESLLEDYRTNSRVLYGCRGIHIPSRTSDSGMDFHFDRTWPMVFWTAGAGWAAHFYFDYWLYTCDDAFFRNRALPFMKEAALFYEDYLYEDETGFWRFSPSYSPENTPSNSDSAACVNATMDISVATELFRNLITGCRTLGIEEESVQKWQRILAKMPPYLENEDGALKEWADPGLADEYDHRHSSHLYMLYYDLPAKEKPEVLAAAKKAYEIKMERKKKEQGTMAFGLVQAGMAAAHLGDAAMTEVMLKSMAENNYYRTYASSHDYGPSIFNADISGGVPALILECIAQCSPLTDEQNRITEYEIRLMPALPKSMASGRVKGLCLRGGFRLEMEWKDGELLSWKVENPFGKKYRVKTYLAEKQN